MPWTGRVPSSRRSTSPRSPTSPTPPRGPHRLCVLGRNRGRPLHVPVDQPRTGDGRGHRGPDHRPAALHPPGGRRRDLALRAAHPPAARPPDVPHRRSTSPRRAAPRSTRPRTAPCVYARVSASWGGRTIIQHSPTLKTAYGHQSKFLVTEGQRRQAGPGHRSQRHDRLVDRLPPALRRHRQRPLRRPRPVPRLPAVGRGVRAVCRRPAPRVRPGQPPRRRPSRTATSRSPMPA